MRKTMRLRRRNHRDGGYAILLVLFAGTLMLILAMSAAPNILTEGRREKEKEMVWRGKQYVRGIKLYYRKMGRFPTSLDDLTKPQMGNIHFMRKAYKDPMNKEDGSWRLIYVGPSGQLIGSLKPPQTLQMPGVPQVGTPAASLANPPAGNSQVGTTPQGGQPGATGQGGESTDTTDGGNPANVPSGDTPTIMGGNIIGVGSKVNQRSIMVYEKARNYRLFEFIWDPSKDAIGVGGTTGTQIGTPAGTTPGTGAPGTTPGMNPNAPLNPPQGPPTAEPNPPQP
jgi:hypothetical protein